MKKQRRESQENARHLAKKVIKAYSVRNCQVNSNTVRLFNIKIPHINLKQPRV
jgi:hypothetical protein